jgi:hypothetical protein
MLGQLLSNPIKLTFLILIVGVMVVLEWLDFATLAVACALKHIETLVIDEMAVLVHISHRPVTELTVVDYRSTGLGTISEGECRTRRSTSR